MKEISAIVIAEYTDNDLREIFDFCLLYIKRLSLRNIFPEKIIKDNHHECSYEDLMNNILPYSIKDGGLPIVNHENPKESIENLFAFAEYVFKHHTDQMNLKSISETISPLFLQDFGGSVWIHYPNIEGLDLKSDHATIMLENFNINISDNCF
jgi:hypothetical protein